MLKKIFSAPVILIISVLVVTGSVAGFLIFEQQSTNDDKFIGNPEFQINVPNNYKKPLLIKTFDRLLSIKPLAAESVKKVQENDITIRYTDAYPNTDVEQIKYPNKLKESIILKGPNHPSQFIYEINIDDYLWEIDPEGNIIFMSKEPRDFSCIKSDDDGCVSEAIARNHLSEYVKIFKIPAPFLIDASGEKSDKLYVETKIEGNKLTLIPDQDWLDSHSYPIILDPTIEKIPQVVGEVSGKRTTTGVTFKNDDGSFTFGTQIGNFIHYYDENSRLQPVDTTIKKDEQGNEYVEEVPYYKGYALDNPGYIIERKDGEGWVKEELLNTDDTTGFTQIGSIQDNKKIFKNVFTDTDFEVEFTASKGVKGNIILKSADSPTTYKFKLSSDKNPQFFKDVEQIKYNKLYVFAKAWDSSDEQKSIPLTTSFNPETQIMTVTVNAISDNVIYPIIIDPDTMPEEQVGASADDAGKFTSWSTTLANNLAGDRAGSAVKAGFRFQTVPIASGSTINSATIYGWHYVGNGTPDTRLYGEAGDAIQFSTEVDFDNRTRTNNYTSISTWSTGNKTVTSVVQDIVDADGWSNNSNMGFLWDNNGSASWAYDSIYSYDGDSSKAPKLNVTYTPAPSNSAPTISSATDSPDPVNVGSDVTFSVDWADSDAEGIKMLICKTDAITAGASPSCDGGEWASDKNDYDLTDPITANYTTQSGDVGTQNYYAFVCDDEPACSSSSSGTFTVESESSPSIEINSGTWNVEGGVFQVR